MPGIPVSEEVLNKYLQDGKLSDEIAANVKLLRMKVLEDKELTENECLVYAKASSDLDEIEALLKSIQGNPKKGHCPYGIQIQVHEGYQFCRFDEYSDISSYEEYQHRHIISITKDDFVWKIGVKQDGNFLKLQNGVNITGYYHLSTNGSLNQIQEALKHTIKYFPQPQPHRYEMRFLIENLRTFSKLLEKISGLKLRPGFLDLGCDEQYGIGFEYNHPSADEGIEKILNELQRIHPKASIEKFSDDSSNIKGIKFLRAELPDLLIAAQKNKLINKSSVTTHSIWHAATSENDRKPNSLGLDAEEKKSSINRKTI